MFTASNLAKLVLGNKNDATFCVPLRGSETILNIETMETMEKCTSLLIDCVCRCTHNFFGQCIFRTIWLVASILCWLADCASEEIGYLKTTTVFGRNVASKQQFGRVWCRWGYEIGIVDLYRMHLVQSAWGEHRSIFSIYHFVTAPLDYIPMYFTLSLSHFEISVKIPRPPFSTFSFFILSFFSRLFSEKQRINERHYHQL